LRNSFFRRTFALVFKQPFLYIINLNFKRDEKDCNDDVCRPVRDERIGRQREVQGNQHSLSELR
jgi:hypothetical protein